MEISIKRTALQTLLYAVLSCKCPVTEETEKRLFAKFNELSANKLLALKPFIDIADKNPAKTPLHLLMEFCSFSKKDPTHFTICHDDALRYLGSRYHFDRMQGAASLFYTSDQAKRMLSHMLIPVTMCKGDDADKISAIFSFMGRSIVFESIFVPENITITNDRCYGFHLGMIVSELSNEQAIMLEKHLAVIPEFCTLCNQVERVDFRKFLEEDHYKEIAIRYNRSMTA